MNKDMSMRYADFNVVFFMLFMIVGMFTRIEPYSLTEHFISDIGLIRIHEKLNIPSLTLYSLAVLCYTMTAFKLAAKVKEHLIFNGFAPFIRISFIISAVAGVFLILLPKDLTKLWHRVASNSLFVFFLVGISIYEMLLIEEEVFEPKYRLVTYALWVIFLMYVIVNETSLRGPGLQKMFVVSLIASLSYYTRCFEKVPALAYSLKSQRKRNIPKTKKEALNGSKV